MSFICDAHVHLYPEYHLSGALSQAIDNLTNLYDCHKTGLRGPTQDSNGTPVMTCCLAERFDCRFFCALRRVADEHDIIATETSEDGCLRISLPPKGELLLFAGRQIATKERLELLALGVDGEFPDNRPFSETYQSIVAAGAIAVLNWAPGKWMFGRKKLVREIIAEASADKLLICDTTLRPTLWAEPILMRNARKRGIKVIAGSDPLPVKGEERIIGTYGFISEAEFDDSRPVSSLRHLLLSPELPLRIVGRRSGCLETVTRLRRYYHDRRPPTLPA